MGDLKILLDIEIKFDFLTYSNAAFLEGFQFILWTILKSFRMPFIRLFQAGLEVIFRNIHLPIILKDVKLIIRTGINRFLVRSSLWATLKIIFQDGPEVIFKGDIQIISQDGL